VGPEVRRAPGPRLRAPFSQVRLSRAEDDRVVSEQRRPWPDAPGVTRRVGEPLAGLRRQAARAPALGAQRICLTASSTTAPSSSPLPVPVRPAPQGPGAHARGGTGVDSQETTDAEGKERARGRLRPESAGQARQRRTCVGETPCRRFENIPCAPIAVDPQTKAAYSDGL
jgi:hypothetical protein